ncbi:hypothetical protein BJG92_00697 [Arthrobacter sp. SO5]|uniref:hypothetical protein n=1 Tax=Arthrobacter sp. SO5 TaxID=1897055 RepID=UPI001E5903A2|nr:hypothetical protein [Arthrobacter sp. SO5]MCB5273183.1 hypothetical protein [Arthrobacter sp. SO5]
MRTANRTPFHGLRSALVALTVVSLAAGAHVTAGGHLPSPGIVLALLALTGLASTAATRLKLNAPALAALLGAGQLALHASFTSLNGPGSGSGSGATVPHHTGSAWVPAVADHTRLHEADPGLSLLMLAGHALATLACAVLLARGEDALWSLSAWLRPLVHLPAPVTPDAVAAPPAAGRHEESVPLPWRNLRPDCRRGPPAAAVVVVVVY